MASLAQSLAASAVQASFSGRRSMSPRSHSENVAPSGASFRLKPRWAWALTAPGMIVLLGKNLTSAPGFSRPMSVRSPTASMRPSLTSTAPSRRGGDEMGIRVPAAKMTGPAWLSGIPPDHLRGHGLKELAFLAVRQEAYIFEGRVDLSPGPFLGPGHGIRGEHSFYACLEQLRSRARVCEDPPDLARVAFAQGEDDRQRHGALDEVRAYALAHKAWLPDGVHYVVLHLKGYAKGLSVAGERVYLHEREPAKCSAGNARSLKQACGLLPYVLQVRLDVDRRPVRAAVLLQFPHCEPHRGLGEGADEPRVPDPRKLRERFGEEVVSCGRRELTPVRGDGGRHAAPALGPVHDIIVDQGGRVEYLYGGRRPEQVLLPGLPHVCAQYQKQRPETFPP